MVLSWNEKTGEREYKEVTELFLHEVELLYEVRIQRPHDRSLTSLVDETILETTWNHPFWVVDKKAWIEVKDLKVGDRVLLSEGKEVAISGIRSYNLEATKVYNFEVADNHTYFVGEDGVLVHNYDIRMGVVEKNDNLEKITKQLNEKYGTTFTVEELAKANGIKDIHRIQPGDVIGITPELFDKLSEDQKTAFMNHDPNIKSIYTASLSGSLSFDLLEKGLSKLGLNIGGSVDGIYYAEQLTKKNALGIFHSTKTGVLMTGTAGESEIKKGNLKHGNQLIPQVSVSVQLGEGIISVQDMIGKNPNMSLISYDPTIPIANVSIGLLGTVKDSYNDYPVMKTRTISAGKSLSLKMKTEGIVSGGKEVKRLRTEYKMISHEDYAIKKQQVLFNWYGHYTQEGQ